MATINISMPDPMRDWVDEQAASGRYATASDYLRDLIRRDQERQAAIDEMQALVDAGEASGFVEDFDPEAFKAELTRKYG